MMTSLQQSLQQRHEVMAANMDPIDSPRIIGKQTIASTPLLQYIQEAHKPHSTSLQASNPVSMNTSFFLQAEGHSADSTGDQSPMHRYTSSGDEFDKQSDRDSQSFNDSQSLREDDSQSDGNSDDSHSSSSDEEDHNSQLDNDNSLYSDDSSIE